MPAAQLVSAALEVTLNKLLDMDPTSEHKLAKLSGKQMLVDITESPWPFVFSFSDRVDVLIANRDEQSQADCQMKLSINTLGVLKDSSQITRLIQNNDLVLDGDIHVAQAFSQLITEMDIDWEEHLSQVTGDVAAHTLMQTGKSVIARMNHRISTLTTVLAEGAIEEKQIAAHKILVVDYCDKINVLRSDTARLEAKIQRLERQLGQD